MKDFLLVGTGGFLGSVLRFGISSVTIHCFTPAMKWPWATLAVNLLGSLLIGSLAGWSERGGLSAAGYSLLAVGFCGGFTTFSTFSLEVFRLMRAGDTVPALCYIAASVSLCVLGAWAGWSLSAGRGDFTTI